MSPIIGKGRLAVKKKAIDLALVKVYTSGKLRKEMA
jgi:hypothetical protein